MDIFRYVLYSSGAEKEKSELEKAFEDLINKVGLYETQYEVTQNLYLTEWKNELEELNKEYNIEINNIQEIYNRLYEETKIIDEKDRDAYASHASGIDNLSDWYLKSKDYIERKYRDFFDLYNKSLMIALYSLVESKLKEVCEITAVDFNKKLKYEYLDSRNYLKTSLIYFDLVIQIPTSLIEPYISYLEEIQFMRNRIIHAESKFSGDNENTIQKIVVKSKGALELNKEGSVNTLRIRKPEFILDFFEKIRDLFEELLWLLDDKRDKKVLGKRLIFWFRILDPKIFLKNIKLERIGKGKRKLEFELSSRKKNIPKFKCRVSIVRANKNSFEIIDQTNSEAINKFNGSVNNIKSLLFDNIFKLFNLSIKGLKVKVIMF
ncbi:MAG: hypothetical protein JNK77_13970 [Saprospiraceae bacterium]|nr:hypothetical protein [Saprospiraceae bacterium]